MKEKIRHIDSATCMKKWGFTPDEYRSFIATHGGITCTTSPLKKYVTHRANAKKRGLDWGFTFASWWAVWQESGKWEERGRGTGFCMARKGDIGGYSPENVYICTNSQNFKDSYIKTPMRVRAAKSRPKIYPKGFRYWKGKKKPFIAQYGRKWLGCFCTEIEARNEYVKYVTNLIKEFDSRQN